MGISTITKPYTHSNGQTADGTKVNANDDTAYSAINNLIGHVNNASGTKSTLQARLDVTLNPDGTARSGVTAGGEWINPELTPTFVSGTQFTVSGDHTDIYRVNRRLKVDDGTGFSHVTAVSYEAGTNLTTVTINDSVLTDPVGKVEHGTLSPGTGYAIPYDVMRKILLISSFIETLLDDASAAAARTTLGLVIGTDVLAPNGDGSGLMGIPQGFTSVQVFPKAKHHGNHDGTGNTSLLQDSSKSWDVDEFVGQTIYNQTDGSSGIITANSTNTITATLSGGTDNDWDLYDAYLITTHTYTKPADLKRAIVWEVGGGGGSSGHQNAGGGRGGAGGGTAIKVIDGASIGETETVTIGYGGKPGASGPYAGGNGGTSSFGSHCSATGGAGGPAGSSSRVDGGGGVGGDINLGGGCGFPPETDGSHGGDGGSSFLAGGRGGPQGTNEQGWPGNHFGGGASGAWSSNSQPGAVGGHGGVIIWEYR